MTATDAHPPGRRGVTPDRTSDPTAAPAAECAADPAADTAADLAGAAPTPAAAAAFYWPDPRDSTLFHATPHTAGPWSAQAQHGGPPSALLTRAFERLPGAADLHLARVTIELLGPVPVGPLHCTARVARPGRSVEMLEAALQPVGASRPVAVARGWRIRGAAAGPAPADGGAVAVGGVPAVPGADDPGVDAAAALGGLLPAGGYLSAVEWRFVHGALARPGPAAVWTRLRVAVCAGEQPSPAQRVLAVADSGNGVSASHDARTTWFINPELTVHLLRPVRGQWVLLEATTHVADGAGAYASSVLSDPDGEVARGMQSLLLGPRPAAG